MASRDAFWTINEKKVLLAEILKASSIAPASLAAFIKGSGITPTWNQVALPGGRSVEDCQKILHELLSHEPVSSPDNATQAVSKKRTLSAIQASTPVGRALQPRPPLSTASEPADRSAASRVSDEGLPKRKRGRPSKAEMQARAEAAAARGEPLPPSKTAIVKPTPSTPSSVPGKRKRGRPSKAEMLARELALKIADERNNESEEKRQNNVAEEDIPEVKKNNNPNVDGEGSEASEGEHDDDKDDDGEATPKEHQH